jgi:hypothetical protein
MAIHQNRVAVLTAFDVPRELIEEVIGFNSQGIRPVDVSLQRKVGDEEREEAEWWRLQFGGQRVVTGGKALELLAAYYPSLRFPVEAGLNVCPKYRAAVAGTSENGVGPIPELSAPEGLVVELEDTGVGWVVVVTAGGRTDFEFLLRCLGRKNRPDDIPAEWGAMYLNGLVNVVRSRVQDGVARGVAKDRVILLSRGPYAGIMASEIGKDSRVWDEESLRLRKAHELTHFVLHQMRGAISKSITEELIADAEAVWCCGGGRSLDTELLQWLLGLHEGEANHRKPRFLTYLPEGLANSGRVFYRRLLNATIQELSGMGLESLTKLERLAFLGSLSLEDICHNTFELGLQNFKRLRMEQQK